MVFELVQMASERHVIADYEVLPADPEELTELHTCAMAMEGSW